MEPTYVKIPLSAHYVFDKKGNMISKTLGEECEVEVMALAHLLFPDIVPAPRFQSTLPFITQTGGNTNA